MYQAGAKTPGTDMSAFGLAIKDNPHLLDVREDLALGPILGVADVVADDPSFAAYLTACHVYLLIWCVN